MRHRQNLVLIAGFLLTFGAASAVQPDDSGTKTKPVPRVVNVTSDSTPGWLPTVEQGDLAERIARDYLAAEYSGDVEKAYGYFTDLNKRHLPFDQFATGVKNFVAKAGPVVEQRIVKVTWTKDPADAPLPMREEANFIDNVSAEAMAQQHDQAFVDRAWAQLSVNCPNYPGFSPQP